MFPQVEQWKPENIKVLSLRREYFRRTEQATTDYVREMKT